MPFNTLAFIPARAGSKGIPQKNILLLKGYPLIAYSIIAAKLSEKIENESGQYPTYGKTPNKTVIL